MDLEISWDHGYGTADACPACAVDSVSAELERMNRRIEDDEDAQRELEHAERENGRLESRNERLEERLEASLKHGALALRFLVALEAARADGQAEAVAVVSQAGTPTLLWELIKELTPTERAK